MHRSTCLQSIGASPASRRRGHSNGGVHPGTDEHIQSAHLRTYREQRPLGEGAELVLSFQGHPPLICAGDHHHIRRGPRNRWPAMSAVHPRPLEVLVVAATPPRHTATSAAVHPRLLRRR